MQMIDAWGGWSLFQVLLRTLKGVATKHGVSIPTVAVRYVLNQVLQHRFTILPLFLYDVPHIFHYKTLGIAARCGRVDGWS